MAWPFAAVDESAIVYMYSVSHLYMHIHERNMTGKMKMQQFYLATEKGNCTGYSEEIAIVHSCTEQKGRKTYKKDFVFLEQ